MPDPLLGPSGQPLQPNPFTQGSQSVTPKLDVSSAQQTYDAFMSHLEEAMSKNFRDREKLIKNLTAGEEDYWKMSTRYANSYAGIINQQHEQRLRDIRQERDAEIDRAKRSEDGLKNLASIRDKYQKQEQEAYRQHDAQQNRISTVSKLHGGVTRAAGTVFPEAGAALGGIGVLVAESATGIGLFVAALELAAKAAVSLSERQAELGRSSAGLIAAGYAVGTKGAKSEDIREALFGGVFTGIAGVGAGRKALGTLSGAPALLGESTSHIEKFQNTLSAFGNIIPDINEDVDMFSKNSRALGLDLNGLNNVYGVSRRAAQLMGGSLKDWNVNQRDTIDMYTDLQKSFRGFTTDADVAAGSLLGLSANLKNLFQVLKKEKQPFNLLVLGSGVKVLLPCLVYML